MFFSSIAASFFGSAEAAPLAVGVTGCIFITRNRGLAGYRFTLARTSEAVESSSSKDRPLQAILTTRSQLDGSG